MGSWASRHAARRFPHTRGNGQKFDDSDQYVIAVPAYAGKWLTLRFAGASGRGSGPRYGSGGHCGHVSVRTLARLVRIAVPG